GSGAFGVLPLSGGPDIANFTLNRSGATVTLNGDLTVLGSLDQFDGTLALNGHTLTVAGDYNSDTGEIISTAASSLIINNSGNLPTLTHITGPMNTLTLQTTGGADLNVSSSTFAVTNLNLVEGALNNATSLSMAAG